MKQSEPRYDSASLRVETSSDFNVSAERVWAIIDGFNSLPDYHDSIIHSELKEGGVVRHITMSENTGGGIVVERLVFFDDLSRVFSCRITDLINPLSPLSDPLNSAPKHLSPKANS